MAKKRTPPPAAAPKRGAGDSAGAEFLPSALPAAKDPDPLPRAVAKGLPMSDDEYEQMLKRAAHRPKPVTKCAHTDPAEDGDP